MDLEEAIKKGQNYLKNSSTARLDIELILCHILKCDKSYLISHSDDTMTNHQRCEFEKLVCERQQGKPIAYIMKKKAFFGRNFFVDERCLIPRPETEDMVEDALQYLQEHPDIETVIDLGSGSGNIAITLALELPKHKIYGIEISSEAMEVANKNRKHFKCSNLTLIESDLLSDLPASIYQRPISILANLPYIGIDSNHFVSDETECFEPHIALFGGSDGLELYRRTWRQIKAQKLDLRALFMEIGFSQVKKIRQETRKFFPNMRLRIKKDLAGLPRTAVLNTI